MEHQTSGKNPRPTPTQNSTAAQEHQPGEAETKEDGGQASVEKGEDKKRHIQVQTIHGVQTVDIDEILGEKPSKLTKKGGDKDERKGETPLGSWELIDGSFKYRPGIVAGAPRQEWQEGDTEEVLTPPVQESCENDSQSRPDYRGSTASTGAGPSEPNLSQGYTNPETCPIGAFATEETDNLMNIEITVQSNNMSEKERLCMTRMESLFGYSQSPDYCKSNARYIYRCSYPKCGKIINPNGLERGLRAHFRKDHGSIAHSVQIKVNKSDKRVLWARIPRPITGRFARRRALLAGCAQSGRLSLLEMQKQRNAVEETLGATPPGNCSQQPIDELEIEQWDEDEENVGETPQESRPLEQSGVEDPKKCPQSGNESRGQHGGQADAHREGSSQQVETPSLRTPMKEQTTGGHDDDEGDEGDGPGEPRPVTGTRRPPEIVFAFLFFFPSLFL